MGNFPPSAGATYSCGSAEDLLPPKGGTDVARLARIDHLNLRFKSRIREPVTIERKLLLHSDTLWYNNRVRFTDPANGGLSDRRPCGKLGEPDDPA